MSSSSPSSSSGRIAEAGSPVASSSAALIIDSQGGQHSAGKRNHDSAFASAPDSQVRDNRPRLETKSKGEHIDRSANIKKGKDRWRPHRITEDYVNFVGDMMYPKTVYPAYGYEPTKGRFPFERITTLGYLLNPMRRPSVAEKWSPYEVSVFEASMTLFGKNFHQVAKMVRLHSLSLLAPSHNNATHSHYITVPSLKTTLQVRSKNTKEVIEFYYFWKKTSHYKQWKKVYVRDDRDDPEVLE